MMNGQGEKQENAYLQSGIPIGAGFGVALGLVFMNVTGHNGMFALGIAIGVCLGTVVGMVLDHRDGRLRR